MEAIKTKGVAHKGVLTVQVPKEFEEKELEVIVLSATEKRTGVIDNEDPLNGEEWVKKFHELPAEERLRILEQYKGTAKFPDFPIGKYDVYGQ